MLVNATTAEPAIRMIAGLRGAVVDTETTGLEPFCGSRLCGVAVLPLDEGAPHTPLYFPFGHYRNNLPEPALRDLIKALSSIKRFVGYNAKFDLLFLHAQGLLLPESVRDVLIAAHLNNENEDSFKLKRLAVKYVSPDADKDEKRLEDLLDGLALDGKGDMGKLLPEEAEPYACSDVVLTRDLDIALMPSLHEQGLSPLVDQYSDYVLSLTSMESAGIKVDVNRAHEQAAKATAEMLRLTNEARDEAGWPIDLSSRKHLMSWLGTTETNRKALDEMKDDKRAKLLIEYRGHEKALTSYLRVIPKHLDAGGAIHPNLHITGTATGRLACSDPNLQAIPQNKGAYHIKDVFVARDGCLLMEADFSQAEIRVATHYSGEQSMAELLRTGADIHQATADKLHIDRDRGKRMNFAMIYGVGAQTLSERLGCGLFEARRHLNAYHTHYPAFRKLYSATQEAAERRGYIRMFTGRRRHYVPGVTETRTACSNLIQGAVAETMRLALSAIQRSPADGARALLTVHDSVLFEVDKGKEKSAAKHIVELMENQPWCSVPMVADVKIGESWGSMKKLPPEEFK